MNIKAHYRPYFRIVGVLILPLLALGFYSWYYRSFANAQMFSELSAVLGYRKMVVSGISYVLLTIGLYLFMEYEKLFPTFEHFLLNILYFMVICTVIQFFFIFDLPADLPRRLLLFIIQGFPVLFAVVFHCALHVTKHRSKKLPSHI